ncbi:hypothetical protein [Micromonospora sp. NPDC023633]|uniref:hypothetical protein n=1 Tax=Micromonospora sp. NPDC023633 TaxID=3154320 RepID=UPI0033CEFF50
MSAVAAQTVERWRRTLDEHRQVDGRCPRCGTRKRCWEWATAFSALLVDEMGRR